MLQIHAYTDGSCNTQMKTGTWASVILYGSEKIKLSGVEQNTTHNRMELLACMKSVAYIVDNVPDYNEIVIYTDSQYVVHLHERMNRLKTSAFLTKSGNSVQNHDLVQQFIYLLEKYPIKLIKVVAHQKKGELENLNIEVDRLARKLLRESLKSGKKA